jgi:hypothetical protein
MLKFCLITVCVALSGCAALGDLGRRYDWESEINGPSSHESFYRTPIPQGGYGESRIMKPDAYGPGVHMDQYGAPVKVAPY